MLFDKYESYFVYEYDCEREVARHIVREYGTAGTRVLELGRETNTNTRIIESEPFLVSEVLYAIRH